MGVSRGKCGLVGKMGVSGGECGLAMSKWGLVGGGKWGLAGGNGS